MDSALAFNFYREKITYYTTTLIITTVQLV